MLTVCMCACVSVVRGVNGKLPRVYLGIALDIYYKRTTNINPRIEVSRAV